jgi:hypothetical protein
MTDTETKKHPRRRRGRRGRKRKAIAAIDTAPSTTTDKVAALRKRLTALKQAKPA